MEYNQTVVPPCSVEIEFRSLFGNTKVFKVVFNQSTSVLNLLKLLKLNAFKVWPQNVKL